MKKLEGKSLRHAISCNQEVNQLFRQELLAKPAFDITPGGDKKFLWSKAKNLDDFENEFNFKKVKVRGIFDFGREFQVDKMKNGEKGADIITPFFTHLNEQEQQCGILVNRGWVPEDLRHQRLHYQSVQHGEIVGLLYRGDAPTKYSETNQPLNKIFTRVVPYDFALIGQFPNREEASQFMLL